ncbi:MAG: CoA ester lyase [Sphingorhabdus sp.]
MNEPERSFSFRPRRSCLYMPGSNARAMEKARSISADVIILDLEDAVAADAKETARAAVCEAVSGEGFGHREVVIRINAPSTPWGADDLTQAAAARPDALLAPKVTSGADIKAIDEAMSAAGAPVDMALWVMIEMPLAILNIAEIAAVANDTRLCAFVMGTNDLAKELRAQPGPYRQAFQTALQITVAAARAHGLSAIDGVYNDIENAAGLEQECKQGRMLGFDGKTLIHPAQLEICNRIFAPSAEEISQAKAVIAAFADPANAGQGVITVGGKMTELLHLEEARRVAAVADAIAQLTD